MGCLCWPSQTNRAKHTYPERVAQYKGQNHKSLLKQWEQDAWVFRGSFTGPHRKGRGSGTKQNKETLIFREEMSFWKGKGNIYCIMTGP